MKYVFGPVGSRRLGRSLGVDPVSFKTCNWNCVYCQLGRTTPLQHERRELVPVDDVVNEVKRALAEQPPGSVDFVTFGGSGEPTLHSGIGRMLRGVQELTEIPVAVLTNGSLLYQPEVRVDLMPADVVLPTLDAGSEELYARINRPRPELTFERLISGLTAFRRVFFGKLWVEVMLIKGRNDDDRALRDIAAMLDLIRPDQVHVNRPVRPPAENDVLSPDDATLQRAARLLGGTALLADAAPPCLEFSGRRDLGEAIASILERHPMSLEELAHALGRWEPAEVGEALSALERAGRVRPVSRMGQKFWGSASARYAAPVGQG